MGKKMKEKIKVGGSDINNTVLIDIADYYSIVIILLFSFILKQLITLQVNYS